MTKPEVAPPPKVEPKPAAPAAKDVPLVQLPYTPSLEDAFLKFYEGDGGAAARAVNEGARV